MGSAEFFKGGLRDLLLYDTALPAATLAQIASPVTSPVAGLGVGLLAAEHAQGTGRVAQGSPPRR